MPVALSSREERGKRDISAITLNMLGDQSLRDGNDDDHCFSPPGEKTFSLGVLNGSPKAILPTLPTEQRLTNASYQTNPPSLVITCEAHAVVSVICEAVDNASRIANTQPPEKRSSILRRTRSKSADFATGRPKTVLFSDAMGLPLVHVRSFDEGLVRLGQTARCVDEIGLPRTVHVAHPFRFVGDQPCSCADFLKRLRQQRVCLESLRVNGEKALGCVQVTNIHFEKKVSVRFTVDGWRTFSDVAAEYTASLGSEVDRFSFSFVLLQMNSSVLVGKIMFAVRYIVDGAEYWDNNYGSNYRIGR